MAKCLFRLLFFCISCLPVRAQQVLPDSLPPHVIDSLEKELDAFLGWYGKRAQNSYLQLSAGITNTQASIMNQALNAQQTAPIYTLQPSALYQHKTGLSVGYTGYYLLQPGNQSWVQHAITPGYYLSQKNWSAGLYYTRFFGNNRFNGIASPYQNDWYAFAGYDKSWIQPALALGYSTGRFTETNKTDSTVRINRPFPRPDTLIRFSIFDTLNIRLRDVSATLSFRHQFVFRGKHSGNYYTLTPSLLLFFSQNNYEVTYSSVSVLEPRTRLFLQDRPVLREQLVRQLQARFPGINSSRNFLGSTQFQWQSVGLGIDAAAYWGKFFVNPNLYLDYYLLSGTDKMRFFVSLQCGLFF